MSAPLSLIGVLLACSLSAAEVCPQPTTVRKHTPTLDEVLPSDRTCCEYMQTFVESGAEPTRYIPGALHEYYSLWNTTRIKYLFFDNRYAGGKAMVSNWTGDMLDEMVIQAKTGNAQSNYPGCIPESIAPAIYAYPVKGKRGCVIGSETPWLEALLLASGAEHITTIEYGAINSEHPQLRTLTPEGLRDEFMRGELEPFDFCFSYSSLEHSGLGRYGDRLEPFGDLEMIARIRCMLKPLAKFYFGVPTSDTDCLEFNAHRVYGPRRLDIIGVQGGWRPLDTFGPVGRGCEWAKQPVHVLQRRD